MYRNERQLGRTTNDKHPLNVLDPPVSDHHMPRNVLTQWGSRHMSCPAKQTVKSEDISVTELRIPRWAKVHVD